MFYNIAIVLAATAIAKMVESRHRRSMVINDGDSQIIAWFARN